MAFNQNQIKANTTPNYFNNKSLFSTTTTTNDNSLVNFYENTINNNSNGNGNTRNSGSNDVLTMMAHNRAGTQHNYYNKITGNEHLEDDDQENSILINTNQQHQHQQSNHFNLSESKELIEINNRLGYYINAVSLYLQEVADVILSNSFGMSIRTSVIKKIGIT